jgi:prepilin-type N-terminal cleavage/methylation domain-containing protein
MLKILSKAIAPQYRKNRKSQGFTLIEVLVVMVMVGVLTAIAAPAWSGFVTNQRLSASQTLVLQAIKTAQSEAKTRKVSDSKQTSSTTRTRITFTSKAIRLDNVKANAGVDQKIEDGITLSAVYSSGNPPIISNLPYLEFDSRGFLPSTQAMPICVNLTSTAGKKKWIKIQTLLGAVVTGDGDCS